MKKKYYILIYIALAVIAVWVFYFSGWKQITVNLIVINLIFLFSRAPLASLFAFISKKRFFRAISSIIVNGVWTAFLLWLLVTISVQLFIAVVSFMIIAISLNFRKIINNIASGILLLTSQQFDIGDLIETNGIQGVVKEINMNNVKLREFDGVDVIIPNSNVYGYSIVKFTHGKFRIFAPLPKEEFKKKRHYREYIKLINKILSSKIKVTKYVKPVEILGSLDPEKLAEHLSTIFDIYEPIFGMRPDYSIDKTRYGRVRINLYVLSEKPLVVLNYLDGFLRDILFELYPDKLFLCDQ
ncbi:MAG: mechanosensitive ion channel family protein [Promethearchaeota archaeon]|jgi:small-conductance mechanosensitive channel